MVNSKQVASTLMGVAQEEHLRCRKRMVMLELALASLVAAEDNRLRLQSKDTMDALVKALHRSRMMLSASDRWTPDA
jgi:hypothetical protein